MIKLEKIIYENIKELANNKRLFDSNHLLEIIQYWEIWDNKEEIDGEIHFLMSMPNIIVKFGRYIPNQQSRKDEILGVVLASPNQYAERIS